MKNTTSYLLWLPNDLLNKIRLLSAKRKATNAPNKTQKAILIELLENGLLVTDETPKPKTAHFESVENANEMSTGKMPYPQIEIPI